MMAAEACELTSWVDGYLENGAAAQSRCAGVAPARAGLHEQAEHVSGETEGPSEAAWQIWAWPPWRERERQTGFISLFLIPLTRSTGPTVVLCAGFMYSQEKEKKYRGLRVRKNIHFCSFFPCDIRDIVCVTLLCFPLCKQKKKRKKKRISCATTSYWAFEFITVWWQRFIQTQMPFRYQPSVQFDIVKLFMVWEGIFFFFFFALTNLADHLSICQHHFQATQTQHSQWLKKSQLAIHHANQSCLCWIII